MSRYWRVVRSAEIKRSGVNGPDAAVLQRMAQVIVETRCASGQHATETDAETGDEVCRWCKQVVDP